MSEGIASVTAQEEASRSGALHLPGLPNSPFPIPGITEFLSSTFTLYQPHYFGTYDSGGSFDPAESHLTPKFWLEASGATGYDLQADEPLALPSRWDVVSAHSFGSFSLMKLILTTDATVPFALFLAPTFSFGDTAHEAGIRLDFPSRARFLTSAFPHTFRFPSGDTLLRFFESTQYFEPGLQTYASPRVPSFFVLGGDDPVLDASRAETHLRRFCELHENRLEFEDLLIVEGGGHDVVSLMSDEVKRRLDECLRGRGLR